MSDYAERGRLADPAAVEAVLAACQCMVAVAARPLGLAGEETTIAGYRALMVLASGGPWRLGDLAAALSVAPSSAGRTCDRLERGGLVRRCRRPGGDRRAVLVSATPAGRRAADAATGRRRELLAGILGALPAPRQGVVADALRDFAEAAAEADWSQWLAAPAEVPAQRLRPLARHGSLPQSAGAARRRES
jgi:DNA-binding MarR family transcriptional regulator